jgi:hypothetical protein
MNIVLKAYKLFCDALMVFEFLACLVKEKNKYKFLLASFKTHTDSKDGPES